MDRNFNFFPKRCCAPARIILLMMVGYETISLEVSYQDGWIAARKGQQTTLNFHNRKSHPKRWNCDKMFLLPFCLGLLDCIFLLDQCWLKDNHFGEFKKPQCDSKRSTVTSDWSLPMDHHLVCIVDINLNQWLNDHPLIPTKDLRLSSGTEIWPFEKKNAKEKNGFCGR